MEFARQEYFWLLLLVPFVILLWGIGAWHQRRMRIRFGNIGNLAPISRISWSGKEWFRGLLFVGALAMMVLALAEPSAVVRELHAIPTPTDLVFLLDTSPSMYGRDMDPSRLGRAERIIERFIFLKVNTDVHPDISKHFKVSGIPDARFLAPDGTELGRMLGFKSADETIELLREAR